MTAFLQSRFPQIIAGLTPRISAAVAEGAELIAEEAKVRVHVDSGDLRDAIHAEAGGLEATVYAGDEDVFYGHMEEFGTTHSSAHPFLIPAAESNVAEVEGLVAASLKTL